MDTSATLRLADHTEDLLAFLPTDMDLMLSSLQSLAGPVDLMSMQLDSDFPLEATIVPQITEYSSPFSSAGSTVSSSEGDDVGIFPATSQTPSSSGLTNDRFLFDDWSPQQPGQPQQGSSEDELSSTTPPFSTNTSTMPFQASPERPYTQMTKVDSDPRQSPYVQMKQPRPFRRPRPGHDGQPPPAPSKLTSLLPKVDKPSLGELNGKMPRPVVVNASPRRRRKTERVTDEEMQAEEEARKVKSVQSARDCRKRKKQYIQGLQLAIQQYEQREAAAQQLIATLEKSISRLQMAA